MQIVMVFELENVIIYVFIQLYDSVEGYREVRFLSAIKIELSRNDV